MQEKITTGGLKYTVKDYVSKGDQLMMMETLPTVGGDGAVSGENAVKMLKKQVEVAVLSIDGCTQAEVLKKYLDLRITEADEISVVVAGLFGNEEKKSELKAK